MSNYLYRVFEPCGSGFSREVIFPDGSRCFGSLADARMAARKFKVSPDSRVCRYHCFRGLEDKDYSI